MIGTELKGRESLVLSLLDEIEAELRKYSLWGGAEGRPAPEAFLSTLPFCVDTLEFPQWLEYVFLPGLRNIISSGTALPRVMLVHPYAEEYFRGSGTSCSALIRTLRKLDACFDPS